jgi:hypothetical protein
MEPELRPQHTQMVEQYLEDVKNKSTLYYMLTVARDGEDPVRSIVYYDNAIDAVMVYDSYNDWGFAKQFLTVNLYEPNGKIHKKILKRPPGIEASYTRQNYIDMANKVLTLKPYLNETIYNQFVEDVAKIFAIDNPRFHPTRFFDNTEYKNKIKEEE